MAPGVREEDPVHAPKPGGSQHTRLFGTAAAMDVVSVCMYVCVQGQPSAHPTVCMASPRGWSSYVVSACLPGTLRTAGDRGRKRRLAGGGSEHVKRNVERGQVLCKLWLAERVLRKEK